MVHKQFQNWVSGVDVLSQGQRQQTQGLLSGVTDENASLMAIEARLAETPSMSALQHSRSGFPGHGAGATTLSVQGLQEDFQRSNRHRFTGPSQEGQVAHLWGLPR